MPTTNNKGKGGKRVRRTKKGAPDETLVVGKVPKKGAGQEYAQVTKMLGNLRLTAKLFNEKGGEKLCIIPGKFRKRCWINKDDIILLGIRSYQDDKCDVIYKYTPAEARKLLKMGELPSDLENLPQEETLFDITEEEQDQQELQQEVQDHLNAEGEIDLENL